MPPEKLLSCPNMKTKEQWLDSEQWHEIGDNDVLELIDKVQQDALASQAPSPELVELRRASEAMLKHYIELIKSGDAGFWNPNEEKVVIELRTAIDAAMEKK